MTMFITVATTGRVVQVSDRRICLYQNRSIKVRDDDTNKAIIVDCHIGNFAIAYAGLAELSGVRTDIAIAEDFGKNVRNSKCPKDLFDGFMRSFGRRFKKVKVHKRDRDILRTDISAAGFLWDKSLFFTRISNHRDLQHNPISVKDSFAIQGRLISKPTRRENNRAAYLQVGGIAQLRAHLLLHEELLQLRRSRYFHRVSGETVAGKLVEIIREFGTTEFARNLVGPNCESVVIIAPPASMHSFKYHALGGSPVQFGPNFVGRSGGGFTNFVSGPLHPK